MEIYLHDINNSKYKKLCNIELEQIDFNKINNIIIIKLINYIIFSP